MGKLDVRLPNKLLAGLRIGPEWKSDIVQMANGTEKRAGLWMYPRWRATGSMAAYTAHDREGFRGIFIAAKGRLNAFRVKDPLDWIVSNEPLAPEIGTDDPVQLMRRYTWPGSAITYDVPVRAPIASTVVIYRDGNPVPGTLDATTGLFTPDSAWTSGTHTWSGQFDHWMRFDSDWGSLVAPSSNVQTADIELVEVK